ncbi:MAG TPA: hypothetical protein VEG60_08990 [Candidatus Binatia bacterium]|nr:hypothetical protein [Candidatus Binatia bacterium]
MYTKIIAPIVILFLPLVGVLFSKKAVLTIDEAKAESSEYFLQGLGVDPEGHAFERFNVWSLPTTFIIDKKGTIVGKAIGYRDWDSEQTIRVLQKLLKNPA